MKWINKSKLNKVIGWVLLSVFLIMSVVYYCMAYIEEKQIVFTSTNLISLIIIGTAITAGAVGLIYLSYKINILTEMVEENQKRIDDCRQLVIRLQRDFENYEDTNVNSHRIIMMTLMDLSKKLGVQANG